MAIDERPRSIAKPTGYLMVFRQGNDVLAKLEDLMRAHDIPKASVAGFRSRNRT